MAEGTKTIKFGGTTLVVSDPLHVQPVSADLFVESRVFGGTVVCLSFAEIVTDGDAAPEARVNARIRLTLAGATDLRNALSGMLDDAMPGKERAN